MQTGRLGVMSLAAATSVALLTPVVVGSATAAQDGTFDGSQPTAAEAWPGGSTTATASRANQFGTDLSGLVYEPADAARPATLWAVRNDPATLFRLERSGSDWVPSTTGGWATGKAIFNPGNSSSPDAEGLAITGAGSAGGVYVASERSNSNKSVSSMTVVRYDVGGSTGSLMASRVWNLTADLPVVDSNQGLESIAWVPDSHLTDAGFVDQRTGAPYVPESYPDHGDGLFFVGVERIGTIYAYALNHSTGGWHRIARIEPTQAGRNLGAGAVMELQYDADRRRLWAVCDNGCQSRAATYEIATSGSQQGAFALSHVYVRPSGLPNANNEGFAFAPDAECSADGTKPVWWADDDQSGGYSIREGTLSCVPPVEPSEEPTADPTPDPTPSQPPQPPAPPSTTPPTVPERIQTTARVRVQALTGRRIRIRADAPGLGRAHLNRRIAVTIARVPQVRGARLRYGVATVRLPRTATARVRVMVVVEPFAAVAANGIAYDVSGAVARSRVTVRR